MKMPLSFAFNLKIVYGICLPSESETHFSNYFYVLCVFVFFTKQVTFSGLVMRKTELAETKSRAN